ncbi:MAG TPA: hypothetical protein PKY05_00505, partial [Fibrobacteria bacterium]|nr:hypothetical protein [Fibrobacteria bacterium]
ALADLLGGPLELASWSGNGPSMLSVHAMASGEWTATDSAHGSNERKGTVGGRIYGVVGGEVLYLSDASIFTRWSDDFRYWDRYALADGEPSGVPFDDPSEDNRYKSNTGARYTAWAQWSRDWVTLKYGRDRVQHGPGEWTGLTTRLSTPPYQMLETRLFPFSWLSVQASVLEAREGEVAGGISFPGDQRKWVHVHRFELQPGWGLAVAFQNQVLYRDSGGVNPAYLLPLVPIFFSQDLSGNRDNSAMQFDATWSSPWRVRLWGALMIDDLNSLTDIAGDNWLNRWALLCGGQWMVPSRRIDGDLTVEYGLVRPWTYTGGREEAFTFAHYGLPMGSELGPDSRTLRAKAAWRPIPSLELRLEGSRLWKGLEERSRLGRVFATGDASDTRTLSGRIWERSQVGFGCTWRVHRSFQWEGRGEWTRDSWEEEDASKHWTVGMSGEFDW